MRTLDGNGHIFDLLPDIERVKVKEFDRLRIVHLQQTRPTARES